jgi:hypothetical protein
MNSLSQQFSANATRTLSPFSQDSSDPSEYQRVSLSLLPLCLRAFWCPKLLTLSKQQPSFIAHDPVNALMVDLSTVDLGPSPDPSEEIDEIQR